MSDLSDDPYELIEDPLIDRQCQVQRMSRPQMLWGSVLLIATVVGDLGAASQKLGDGSLACFFIGLWLAQYVAIWLLVHSYVATTSTRFILGGSLTLVISLLVIIGMSIAWPPVVPRGIILIMLAGSLILYALSGWVQKLLLKRSGLCWFPDNRAGTWQISIRVMLALMVVAAVVAMGVKWLNSKAQPYENFTSISEFVTTQIWLGGISLSIGFLSFCILAAIRSRSRRFYIPVLVVVALVGPWVVQTVGLWIVNMFLLLQASQRMEYYQHAYAIEAGMISGILAVIPLLPGRDQALKVTDTLS